MGKVSCSSNNDLLSELWLCTVVTEAAISTGVAVAIDAAGKAAAAKVLALEAVTAASCDGSPASKVLIATKAIESAARAKEEADKAIATALCHPDEAAKCIAQLQTGMGSTEVLAAAIAGKVVAEAISKLPKPTGDSISIHEGLVAYPPVVFQEMFSRKGQGTQDDVKTSLRLSGVKQNWVVKRYSVSKIPIYSGMVFSIFWLIVFIHTINWSIGSFLPNFLVALPK